MLMTYGGHMAATTTPLTFEHTSFDVLDQGGQPWLTGLQIASALGYRNPSADARNIYTRNAAEFTASMTRLVTLPTAGGPQQVRIFSLRGAHLLAMFARTGRAKAFRRWVLDVLDGTAPAPAAPVSLPAPDGPQLDVVIRGALAAIAADQAAAEPGRPDWIVSHDPHQRRITLQRLGRADVVLDYDQLPERIRMGCIVRTETLAAILTAAAEQLTERTQLQVEALRRSQAGGAVAPVTVPRVV